MYYERLWTLQDVFFPQAETSGTAGRARFFVPRDHLEYLVENRFTVPQIAEMIDVSPRTVHLETVSDTRLEEQFMH